ncbi:pyocin knob domain-containing protein [Paenibacillus eucommiae]|uniref:Tail fiber protein n=1 Tax=Paenibacillus eucommiae TaxID=1355755 RepID=A0ABS4IT39_9BACL|nr:pyocin knob domain-containing protein [Paenibacillus eucommiae]MBP1990196.1 hypothetical protein [Paenibacillus eucommiae]
MITLPNGIKKIEANDNATVENFNANADVLNTKFDGTAGHKHSGAAGEGAKIDHVNLLNKGTNTHAQIDAHIGAGGTAHPVATTAAAGFQSAADKAKLDGISAGATNYVHPATHPPGIIAQDASNRFVTDAEKTTWNAKAPLESPAFTGVSTAPTPALGVNNTQIATTAFVQQEISADLATVTPLMDGVGAVGTSTKLAREDHVHPTDTSRASLVSPVFSGTPFAPKAAFGTNTNQIASMAAVQDAVSPKVNKAGDTMTGALTLPANPTANLHAATKQYVDAVDTTAVKSNNMYWPGNNANTCTKSGVYYFGAGSTGTPNGDWCTLEVLNAGDTTRVVQIANVWNLSVDLWTRRYNAADGWTPWAKILTTNNTVNTRLTNGMFEYFSTPEGAWRSVGMPTMVASNNVRVSQPAEVSFPVQTGGYYLVAKIVPEGTGEVILSYECKVNPGGSFQMAIANTYSDYNFGGNFIRWFPRFEGAPSRWNLDWRLPVGSNISTNIPSVLIGGSNGSTSYLANTQFISVNSKEPIYIIGWSASVAGTFYIRNLTLKYDLM